MAILRSIPRRVRGASYRGRIMIDSVRGTLRVRRWPKKRGPPRSPLQRWWVSWFIQANLLAKYVDGMQAARFIEMTKDSGLYPRDVALMAMRGRLYNWADETGWRWYSMAAIGDISESLDVLGQTIGDILVRAADRWRPIPAGNVGDVVTKSAPGLPPVWQAPSGGIVQAELAESPISPDSSVNNYVFDVSTYIDVEITCLEVDLDGSSDIQMEVSTDAGVSYHNGAADYVRYFIDQGLSGVSIGTVCTVTRAPSSTNHNVHFYSRNLRARRSTWGCFGGVTSGSARTRSGFYTFDGPVTHIKFKTTTGTNFKNGTIIAIGTKAA